MSEEKRDSARLGLGRLQGDVMVFQPMVVKEVSLRGALVETRFVLNLNSLHDLRLELGAQSVVIKGRVVHSQIADVQGDVLVYWTGMEFVEPSQHVSAAIENFLTAAGATHP
jgi:hypothetical protein